MKSIKKSKKKLINTENVVITILTIFIILITALGMVVKHYEPNPSDALESKYKSELLEPESMDRSLIVTLD